MQLIQRGIRILDANRPFAGDLGVKVYAGLGSEDAIQYRPNEIVDQNHLCLNSGATNDVSVATAVSPDTQLMFDMPDDWLDRDDVWLQIRTFAEDFENDSISGSRLLVVDADGDGVDILAGTARIISVESLADGDAEIQFTWTPDPQSVRLTKFAAVRTAGPTSPADTLWNVQNTRIQTNRLTGLSAGTYTFRLEARVNARALVLLSFNVIIPATPESTITITFEED